MPIPAQFNGRHDMHNEITSNMTFFPITFKNKKVDILLKGKKNLSVSE